MGSPRVEPGTDRMGAVDDFVIARNPDGQSTLPFLIRLPLTEAGIVLKVRDAWPRTAKVYRHPSTDWPPDSDIIERVPVRSCVRRGAASMSSSTGGAVRMFGSGGLDWVVLAETAARRPASTPRDAD
jgi:hypothetical protein